MGYDGKDSMSAELSVDTHTAETIINSKFTNLTPQEKKIYDMLTSKLTPPTPNSPPEGDQIPSIQDDNTFNTFNEVDKFA